MPVEKPTARAKADHLVHEMGRLVSTGVWKPKQRVPNRDALMEEYGVSRTTIQKAFDNLIRHGFFESRGMAGTYVKEDAPCLTQIGLINAIKPGIWTPNFHRISRECLAWNQTTQAEVTEHGDKRFVAFNDVNAYPGNPQPGKLLEAMNHHHLSGCIFLHAPEDTFDLKQLDDTGVPYMLWGWETNWPYPSIAYDVNALARQVAHYTSKLGCKRLGVITHHVTTQESILTLRGEAESLGIDLPIHLIQNAEVRQQYAACQAAMLMGKLPKDMRPDCIFVTEEFFMEQTCLGLARAGIEIGRDIQLIGRTDIPCDQHVDRHYLSVGFDVPAAINMALETLNSMRQGIEVPNIQMIKPIDPNRFVSTSVSRIS